MTLHTGATDSGELVPTVTDNAVSLGIIHDKVLGVFFAPTTDATSVNGQLSFGGTDQSLFLDPLTTV